MNCSCRTSPLRIFVKTLTGLRVSNSTILTAARRIQPPYSKTAGFQSQLTFSRAYSATAALRFPQQSEDGVESHPVPTEQASEITHEKSSDDAAVEEQPSIKALDAPADDLDRAKRKGAILDFTPESIDALVANLDKPPTKRPSPPKQQAPRKGPFPTEGSIPSNLRFEAEDASEPEPEPEPEAATHTESSRLKRLKIMKKEKPPPRGQRERPKEAWRIQKEALKAKFPEGWNPRKRLSPDALDGIRALHAQFPEIYTTRELSKKFEVSPEAIRRVLRSKWRPDPGEEMERQDRWFGRGKTIWSKMAAIGTKPPRRWRAEGIVREPYWNRRRGPRTQPPRNYRRFEQQH